jgi:hypothetical protein
MSEDGSETKQPEYEIVLRVCADSEGEAVVRAAKIGRIVTIVPVATEDPDQRALPLEETASTGPNYAFQTP